MALVARAVAAVGRPWPTNCGHCLNVSFAGRFWPTPVANGLKMDYLLAVDRSSRPIPVFGARSPMSPPVSARFQAVGSSNKPPMEIHDPTPARLKTPDPHGKT